MVRFAVKGMVLFLGFFQILFLWLADINILTQSTNGFFAKTHVVPSITIPAILLVVPSILFMIYVNYYFFKEIKNKKKENRLFSALFSYSSIFGIFLFIIGTILMISLGHDSIFLGFASLGVYHSALPLIVLSVLGQLFLE